jgi:hypothetical protein
VKAKYIVVTTITTLLLFVLGFWFLPTLLGQLTKSVIENDLIAMKTEELRDFTLANAALLAACAPAAAVMLWAYSRKRPGWPRVYGFFLCLLITIASAATGIGLRLFVIADQMRLVNELGTIAIPIDTLHYSQWGGGALVIICGAITIVQLRLSQQRTVVENM